MTILECYKAKFLTTDGIKEVTLVTTLGPEHAGAYRAIHSGIDFTCLSSNFSHDA